MKKNYVLEWLDDVVSIQLNPEVKGHKSLSREETTEIKQRIEVEERAVISRLKNRLFNIQDEAASRSLVKKYHDDLILLISKNHGHLHHPAVAGLGLGELHEFIGARLHYILFLFEKELATFLNTENLVPITELLLQKSELLEKADEMRKNLATGEYGMAPVGIVMEVIEDFISKIENRAPITIRESSYIRELMHDVLGIDGNLTSITGCDAINELLIIWNLNSKNCIRYFTTGTQLLMDSKETEEEKVALLKLESKKLDIIPERQNFILDPDFPSVKEYCYKWLNNEIAYRETRLEGFVPKAKAGKAKKEPTFKVTSILSVDQFSLIMRGADEKNILISPSLSAVYEAVTPYMSTKNKVDISPNSARNKSYNAERSDKEVAKWALMEIHDAIDRL